MKIRIYIAGPISLNGNIKNERLIERNLESFHSVARSLRALGHAVENPAESLGGPGWEWIDWMRSGIGQLVYCNGVCLLDGWERSRGARVERELALGLGLDVREASAWGVTI